MARQAVLKTTQVAGTSVLPNQLVGDTRQDEFKRSVIERRNWLTLANNDRNLALRIFDRLSRESYGQLNREQFIINELDFEIQLAKAGGFTTIMDYYLSELALYPLMWEARSIRKRD
jgi:hypothetical protein